MKYHYYYGDKGGYEARCRVEILDGPVDAPRVIMTDDGKMYERVELSPEQSGRRGQCDRCVLNGSRSGHMGKCPPVHDCGANRPITVKAYDNTGEFIATLRHGTTKHHIRWDIFVPSDPVEKIDIVNVEI